MGPMMTKLAAALSVLLAAGTVRAEGPFERRGLRRAGIALFTAGVSSWPSSLALLLSTEGRLGPEAAGMLVAGEALVAAGIPMWAAGDSGRRTTPRDAGAMYAGMALAGIGLGILPPSSALLAASFDPGASEQRVDALRIAALAGGIAGHVLVATGIPIWAWGAASPDDVRIDAGPGGLGLSGRFW
jgi:hypothetical protein